MAGEKTINTSYVRGMRRYGTGYTTVHNASVASDIITGIYITQEKLGANYFQIQRVALIFDTSEIPVGTTIFSTIMQVNPSQVILDSSHNLVVRNGQPTYPHNPVVIGDYLYSHYSGNGGSIAASALSIGIWNDITFNSTGRSWVQRGGVTKLVLINSRDISSTPPIGDEIIRLSAVRLVITYSVKPAVTIQSPTNVLPTTATANGNITYAGDEENCTTRGFKYGLTRTDTWDVHDGPGSYEAGAYTKELIKLTANTTYWIQAYATNSKGTSYSDWIRFQTAAVGTIPVGTRINVCSDYSGYTYKINSSLLDDGESYESYFVLSTDLAQKQGLHINKRLEDLHSYFMKKDSGTAKIYIKRDNEAEWQYAGEVSLTGDEDIIVKHLPSENEDSIGDVDFLAKHFLIKFAFTNDFEFIGIITEAIPIGAR